MLFKKNFSYQMKWLLIIIKIVIKLDFFIK